MLVNRHSTYERIHDLCIGKMLSWVRLRFVSESDDKTLLCCDISHTPLQRSVGVIADNI